MFSCVIFSGLVSQCIHFPYLKHGITLNDCNSGKKYLYFNILPDVLQSAGKDFGIKMCCEVANPGPRPGIQPGSLAAMPALSGVFTFTLGLSNLGFVFKDNLHFI